MMEQTPNEILAIVGSNKHLYEPMILIRELQVTFDIDPINPIVGIKVWLCRGLDEDEYTYTVSHYFKVPGLSSAYVPGSRSRQTEQAAIQEALSTLTMHFPAAISDGAVPDESWVVCNSNY